MQRTFSVCAATVLAALILSFLTRPAHAAINVVAYWHLGEKDAGATDEGVMYGTIDSVGGRTITTVNNPKYSSSVASAAVTATGSGLCFQSSDLGYGTSALLAGLTNNFGIELWVKPSLGGDKVKRCLVYNGDSGANGWGLFQAGRTYQGSFGGIGSVPVGSAPAMVGKWMHLALIRNNSVTTLYANGVAAGATSTFIPERPTGIFSLGVSGGGEIFSGSLDEVRVFTFAAGQFNIANLLVFAKPSPSISLNGAATMTNECHTAFTDSGATATGAPLAIAAGEVHSLALKSDGMVAAWGDNRFGQTTILAGLSNVVAIAAGAEHSLALKSDGMVAAWGWNDYGQTNIPVGLSNVVAIAGGYIHNLALKSDGTVAAWGNASHGETTIPVDLSNVVSIAAGGYHSLALKSDGTVVAWGDNSHGETTIPVGLSNVVAISAGSRHNLALRSDGTGVAWGSYNYGQTIIFAGLSNVVAIAAGEDNSLVLKSDGMVAACGNNNFGQITIPVNLSNVVAIAAGGYHSLALKSDGTVVAWGDNSSGLSNIPADLSTLVVTVSGSVDTNAPDTYLINYTAGMAAASRTVVVQDTTPPTITLLGNNPLTNTLDAPFVDPGATALDACGGSFAGSINSTVNIGVAGSYTVTYTFADSYSNTTNAVRTVVVSPLPLSVTTLAATGASNTVATLHGMVNPGGLATTAWFEWKLPFGNANVTAPVAVGSNAAAVMTSNFLSGLMPGMTYYYHAVGSNALGVVRGNDVPFGSPAISLNGAATMTNECHTAFTDPGATATGAPLAIAVGDLHNLALKSDGMVAAWGDNNNGQTNIPVGLSNVVAIAGGEGRSLALKSDGTVVAWGYNGPGQTNILVGLSNVVAIAAGGYHNLALKSNETVVAWGNNGSGQTNIPHGLSNVVAIAAGFNHSLALKSDGVITMWGDNTYGQTNIPVSLSNVVAIAAGWYHNLALKSDGTVAAWGANYSGQTTIPVGLSNVVAIAGGGDVCLALKSDGTVAAWGWNTLGQTATAASLSNVVAIAGGHSCNLALKSDGTVFAWGNNDYGQTNVPANLRTLAVNVSGNVNTNAPGTYLLNYTATNILGMAAVSRTVVVQDTTPPVIIMSGVNPMTNALNVPFVDLGVLALDACGGYFAVSAYSTVNVSAPGVYTVTYVATDGSGNSVTNMRTVIVPGSYASTSPMLISPVTLGNGAFRFSFTSDPNALLTVWISTNLALPFNAWSNLGPAVETPIGSGQFQFTDLQATNNPQRFYRVRSP